MSGSGSMIRPGPAPSEVRPIEPDVVDADTGPGSGTTSASSAATVVQISR